jgi:hypothetical protein
MCESRIKTLSQILPCGLSNPQQKVELNIGWQWRHLSVVGESDFSGKSMETKR